MHLCNFCVSMETVWWEYDFVSGTVCLQTCPASDTIFLWCLVLLLLLLWALLSYKVALYIKEHLSLKWDERHVSKHDFGWYQIRPTVIPETNGGAILALDYFSNQLVSSHWKQMAHTHTCLQLRKRVNSHLITIANNTHHCLSINKLLTKKRPGTDLDVIQHTEPR